MKCRICGSYTARAQSVRTRGGGRKKLFFCADCDFAFFAREYSNLIRTNQFERERLRTAGLRIPDIKTDFDNGFRQALEYRKAYIRVADRSKLILEIGCSWGYFLKRLKIFGVRPVGLEINPVRADFVRSSLHIPCYQSLEKLEQEGMSFSKIFLFYVIQYIKDPAEYCSRLMKLLERGGCIYILTPNHHDVLKDVWQIKEYQNFFYEKMTVSYYSIKSLKRLAQAIGRDHHISFQVETKQGYSFFNHLMWYFDGRPRITGIVAGDRYAADIKEKLILSSTKLGRKLTGLVKEFDYNYRSAIEKELSGNQLILTLKK